MNFLSNYDVTLGCCYEYTPAKLTGNWNIKSCTVCSAHVLQSELDYTKMAI